MDDSSDTLRRNAVQVRIVSVDGNGAVERPDRVAAEEPMEIRVGGPRQPLTQVAVTMRTPGGDFELAAGFLFTEGLVSPEDVARVAYCDDLDDQDQRYNVVRVRLTRGFDPSALGGRNFFATSSCGVCGKASLDDVEVRCTPVASGPVVTADVIRGLPEALRERQRVFDQTGGLHAAGLFGEDGSPVALREDVGRHNAVDKVIGEAVLRREIPLSERILQVSGRASFEIVQKAAVAGIPILSAVSAPSSLAVEAAERLGLTLVGFARGDRFNVYAHPERIAA